MTGVNLSKGCKPQLLFIFKKDVAVMNNATVSRMKIRIAGICLFTANRNVFLKKSPIICRAKKQDSVWYDSPDNKASDTCFFLH